jgi:glucosamine-6-phosphate deaminase
VQLHVFDDPATLGRVAATVAAEIIADSIAARGRARIIAATGASQFQFLSALVERRELPWSQVELFHLDEYLNIPPTHPASFRKYLNERLIGPTGITTAHLLDGEQDPEIVCQTIGHQIASAPIDVAFVGIGENGHLAFNDPPADFDTREPYSSCLSTKRAGDSRWAKGGSIPSTTCRRAPSRCRFGQILEARHILCIVPDLRKAEAVRASVEGTVTPSVPASILQTHAHVDLFLDRAAASLLTHVPALRPSSSILRLS